MKKFLAFAFAAVMAWGAASAQVAFGHVGLSLEAGLAGLGANLSIPIVTNHLIFTVGYNMPALNIKADFEIDSKNVNTQMSGAVAAIKEYNLTATDPITTANLQTSLGKSSTEVTAKLNFANWKFLLELYPTLKSNFHITAGVFVGDGNWLDVSGRMEMEDWAAFRDVVRAHKVLTDRLDDAESHTEVRQAAKFSVGDEAFYVDPETGDISLGVSVQRIKPYVGIGFGSSVPMKHRMGFQMELGAYYQGAPKLQSDFVAETTLGAEGNNEIDPLWNTFNHFEWYPTLTLRWTGRLF